VKVLVFNQQKNLSLSAQSVKSVVKEVLVVEGVETNEVAVYFVSTQEICRLHAEFFHDPSPTDCISFPIDGTQKSDYHILGEIFICPQTALEYISKEKNGDPYQETTLYLVHGLLHLLGYDDLDETDQTVMRAAEKKHMKNLVSKDLILKSTQPRRKTL
jgi:probable rRNA maturation factor